MKSIFNLNKNLVKRASTSTAKKSLKLEDLMISFILKTGSFGNLKDQGIVLSVTDGVAKAIGLKTVSSGELVSFKNNLKGMALNLEKYQVGIIIFGNDRDIKQGDSVSRTYSIIKIPVGPNLLGHVIDSLGNPLDGTSFITKDQEYYNIDSKAPGIITRKSVHQPLQTGIIAIDSMVPIGLGQRELIIGDKQTGKTAIAIDTIINQKNQKSPVNCVYVAVGQKRSTVAQLVNRLKKENAFSYSIIVSATASDAASLQFLAPYAGAAVGE